MKVFICRVPSTQSSDGTIQLSAYDTLEAATLANCKFDGCHIICCDIELPHSNGVILDGSTMYMCDPSGDGFVGNTLSKIFLSSCEAKHYVSSCIGDECVALMHDIEQYRQAVLSKGCCFKQNNHSVSIENGLNLSTIRKWNIYKMRFTNSNAKNGYGDCDMNDE